MERDNWEHKSCFLIKAKGAMVSCALSSGITNIEDGWVVHRRFPLRVRLYLGNTYWSQSKESIEGSCSALSIRAKVILIESAVVDHAKKENSHQRVGLKRSSDDIHCGKSL